MRGFAAMCLVRFRRSLAAVYEAFKGSDALCARRNLFVGGRGGLNHAWNYLGVLVLTQVTEDMRIARSISAGAYDGFPDFGSPMVAGCAYE